MQTACPAYDGSVITSRYPVMDVLKTISLMTSLVEPILVPLITVNENYDLDEIIPRLKAYTTGKVVEKVTCSESTSINTGNTRYIMLFKKMLNRIHASEVTWDTG